MTKAVVAPDKGSEVVPEIAGRVTIFSAGSLAARPVYLPLRASFRHFASHGRYRRFRTPTALSFLLLVLVPTAFIAGYLLLYASNRYTSEFRVTVRTVEPLAQASGGLVSLLGLSSLSQASTDSHAVVQYLQSRQAVEDLSRTVPVRALYSSSDIDWWSRLKSSATIEDLTYKWEHMLDVYFESTTGTIVVKVTAFSPQAAQTVAQGVLTLSESLVNDLSRRSRRDSLAFAQQNLQSAEARLTDVSSRLKMLRDTEGVLDPRKAAETTLSLSARLRGQISSAKAELEVQRKYLAENSPSVTQAKETIKALTNELARIDSQATEEHGADNRPLSSIMGAFEQLENDRVFAERAYQSALTALEAAKLEAIRQQVYLATIIRPEVPEEASFPKPFRNIATVLLIALASWVIALFSFYAIREHV